MNENANERTMEHVMDAIVTRNQGVPNFCLLLGSGASITSGVSSANGLIDDWRKKLHSREKRRISYRKWLEKEKWYKSEDEYSTLFELMYDRAELRRAFVEEKIVPARPSIGYMYLTNLLKNGLFNVVFTTNFDDLLSEACYLYSEELRPIVCAHDSAVNSIRITSARPKIIKLHGDYLFENIKNTMSELETLESNMKKKFLQFACEYGLIVVGYSGRDRSVMDMLELLVRHDDYFKQGIYWCELDTEEERRTRLSSLLKRDKVFIAKIPGFDEFMAELHHMANLSLPEPMVNPLWMARDRQRLISGISKEQRAYSLIDKDINEMQERISQIISLEDEGGEGVFVSDIGSHLPASLKATLIRQKRGLESALEAIKETYEEDPDDFEAAYDYADTLARLNKKDDLKEFLKGDVIADDFKTYFLLFTGDDDKVIGVATAVLTAEPSNTMARINRAISLRRLGRLGEMKNDLKILEDEVTSINFLAGIAALRNQKDELLRLLEKALEDRAISVDDIEVFPVFEEYHEDRDLMDLCEKFRRTETKEE